MASPLYESRRSERGMSLIIVGAGFMALMAASMLAIDVGMLMTARSQSQNAADAGALAGAIALAFDDFNDHTPTGPAVMAAMGAAKANGVMGQTVSVEAGDVEFPAAPDGQFDRVRVTVRRTTDRGNPLNTFIGRYLNRPTANVGATATAEAAPANAMTCVKPFIIPDQWTENTAPADTYDAYDNHGNPLANPDVYIDWHTPARYTGYNQERNRGQRLMLRAGTGNNINTSFYFSLAIGGNTGGNSGADAYRWNIANCNTSIMHLDELVIQEPGNMNGPTIQGVQDLYDRDPSAYWDVATKSVKGSTFTGQSPRVFPIPLYHPEYYDQGKLNGRYADLKVANWIGFFLDERPINNEIWGRIIPIGGIRDSTTDGPVDGFAKAIRLVE